MGANAIAFAHSCREALPLFLEEPVWPPEDFTTLAEVRTKGGLDIAAGENACTAHQFSQMMQAGAVSHAQPSVTKVGGITEYLKVVALADELGVRLVPHSPYFGPGLLATLQLFVAARRLNLRRDILHEARRQPLARSRRCRRQRHCRSTYGTGPRLRAGPGSHGAIPDKPEPLRALLRRRGILGGRASAFFLRPRPSSSAPPADRRRSSGGR